MLSERVCLCLGDQAEAGNTRGKTEGTPAAERLRLHATKRTPNDTGSEENEVGGTGLRGGEKRRDGKATRKE